MAVYLIFLSSACATAEGSARLERARGGDEGSAPVSIAERANRSDLEIPTLLVENALGRPIADRLNGFRIGTATGGRSCIEIPRRVGEIVLEFAPLATRPELAWPVHLGESLHWRVSVGRGGMPIKYDLASLTPAESSCMR